MADGERRTAGPGPLRCPPATWLAIALSVVALTGCTSSDSSSLMPVNGHLASLRPGDSKIKPVSAVPDNYRPTNDDGAPIPFGKDVHDDGSPMHYADGSPAFMPDGTPIDYRPRNIQRQIERLGVLYVRDDGQEPLGHEGPKSRPAVVYLSAGTEHRMVLEGDSPDPRPDPATGRLCWLAYECRNPQCPGRESGNPLVFAAAAPTTAEETEEAVTAVNEISRIRMTAQDRIKCPKCGQRDSLQRAELPEARRRLVELETELARIRAITASAATNDTP